jgi:stage III sporulation protein AB
MIKLMGACFVVIASTWVGFQLAQVVADRPRQIRQLCAALAMLKTEIGYGIRPLLQACEQIAQRDLGMISRLFQACCHHLVQLEGASTYECFRQGLLSEWKSTAMKKAEQAILLQLCQTLGMSDREDQLHHLTLAITHLEVEEMNALEEQKQYEKMYKTIGVLTGALIVLLMY